MSADVVVPVVPFSVGRQDLMRRRTRGVTRDVPMRQWTRISPTPAIPRISGGSESTAGQITETGRRFQRPELPSL